MEYERVDAEYNCDQHESRLEFAVNRAAHECCEANHACDMVGNMPHAMVNNGVVSVPAKFEHGIVHQPIQQFALAVVRSVQALNDVSERLDALRRTSVVDDG